MFFICPFDSLLAAMLMLMYAFSLLFESCGECYGGGMEQEAPVRIRSPD